ncbi:MAG: hypothetical protein ABSG80_08610 [Verrucomicrobiota bacterium]|jgi:hypothetical protein
MTKEFPMTNPECPGAGDHFVIRASLFFKHYGFVIRHSIEMRLSWLPRPTGLNQNNPLPGKEGCGFPLLELANWPVRN